MKKQTFIAIAFILCVPILYLSAQDEKFSGECEFVSVSFAYPHTPWLPCDTLHQCFNPLAIYFHFDIQNNSDCDYFFFGSNTIWLLRNNDNYSEDGILGEFYLVNGNDSILLFSRGYGLPLSAGKNKYFAAGIDYIESLDNELFGDFLCRFSSKDKVITLQKISHYLKEAKIIYIPCVADYERIINKCCADMKDKITYPKEAIEIKMPNPLYLSFGTMDDGDEDNSGVFSGDSIIKKSSEEIH